MMKKVYYLTGALVLTIGLFSFTSSKKAETTLDSEGNTACEVYGKIKFVDYGEDYKVKFVDYGQDVKIKMVDYGENSKGKWKEVDYGQKYKIKKVDYGEDFKVKLVDYGEGC